MKKILVAIFVACLPFMFSTDVFAYRTSDSGKNIIKEFEGLRLKPYKCPAGYWTIGWGHRISDGEYEDGITVEQAEQLLNNDLYRFERHVNKSVEVKLNQNQFDALVSFSFNVGTGAFSKSTLLKKLNNGDYDGAANEFPRWNKGGGKVLKGLVRRRQMEKKLFES